MDIHVKVHRTEMYKKNVINMGTKVHNNMGTKVYNNMGTKVYNNMGTKVYNNMGTKVYNNMGTKVYNNLPGFIKEIDDYKAFKNELKLFLLLLHTFYTVEEFVSS